MVILLLLRCMYVCLSVSMYVCVYICLYVSLSLCIYVYVYICVYVFVFVLVLVFGCSFVFVCARACVVLTALPPLAAMLSLTRAVEHRSLSEYTQALSLSPVSSSSSSSSSSALSSYSLAQDVSLALHLRSLADTLAEQHLQRLLEPFSVVEVSHIAQLTDMPQEQVEHKYAIHSAYIILSNLT